MAQCKGWQPLLLSATQNQKNGHGVTSSSQIQAEIGRGRKKMEIEEETEKAVRRALFCSTSFCQSGKATSPLRTCFLV